MNEGPTLNTTEAPADNIETEQKAEIARHISDMYVRAAAAYLEEEDPLRMRITDYYARPETEQELLHLLGNKNEAQTATYVDAVEDFTGNPSRFIGHMEKAYELQDVHKRRRESDKQDRLATDEEYRLGAYADVLETQVRSAVLAAQKKGYITFQSGFKEKSERDQFMDFHNREVPIPNETLGRLAEQSIEVKVEHFDDRTTLTLHPVGETLIRLAQWEQIWNTLIESLPTADSKTVSNMKSYSEHAYFRAKQDSIRG